MHYLRVRPIEVEPDVAGIFEGEMRRDWPFPYQEYELERWGKGYWPLVDFDACFGLYGDDTPPAAATWRFFWDAGSWRSYVADLLASIRIIQSQLHQSDDFLIQSEIARMERGIHRQDYLPNISRDCRITNCVPEKSHLPTTLFQVIEELIVSDKVQSVACPFDDFWLWRRLVEEQLKRSQQLNRSPQVAFSLCTDGERVNIPYSDWGGKVHCSYEGICGADLFIKPDWRKTFPEADGVESSLSDIVFYTGEDYDSGSICHYFLTDNDLGELMCATRRDIGDGWILYESKRPYRPNPNFKTEC